MTQERHALYCETHGFDYQQTRKFIVKNPDLGQWAKVELIRRAMGEYKYIVWLDADAFIADISVDLRQACDGIGSVKFYTPYTYKTHYNVGVLYISNSEETRAFVAKWQAGFPGPKNHREQTIFNDLKRRLYILAKKGPVLDHRQAGIDSVFGPTEEAGSRQARPARQPARTAFHRPAIERARSGGSPTRPDDRRRTLRPRFVPRDY